jgi:hypothetical protein
VTKAFDAILKKATKSEPNVKKDTLYHRIEAFQKRNGILSTRLGQNAYAYEVMGIHINKLGLNEKETEELQDYINKNKRHAHPFEEKSEVTNHSPQLRKKVIEKLGINPHIVNEANKMAKVYPDIFLFENIVRHTIMTILEKKHGKDWWITPNLVSKEIRDKVVGRKDYEKENRWHSARGAHEIFYTDFSDLSRIIQNNANDFKKVFGDLQIEAEMKKLELSRNIIAHNNSLPANEIKRIDIALDDLKKQLDVYSKKS